MKVGIVLPIGHLEPGVPHRYAGIRDLALQAEAGGLDRVWLIDHLLSDGLDDAEVSPWECWTVLSALAEATSTVGLGTLVLCTSFRNAAVTARMADTLQEVSGDRLLLGIGCGWHKPEYDAFGMPFVGRVDGFEEAAKIITGMLRDGSATVDGRHHRADRAPVRRREGRTAPEILIASKAPRMQKLTALYADSWNLAWFGRPNERFATISASLDEACEQVGRDPATLRRTAGIFVEKERPKPTGQRVPIGGTAEDVADGLRAWEQAGVDEVIANLEPATPDTLDLLVAGVRLYRG